MKRFHRRGGAQYVGVSQATFDRALAKGEIRHFRIGRRLIFTEEHLDEYLQSKERPRSEKHTGHGLKEE